MRNIPIPAPLSDFRIRRNETLILEVIERDHLRCQRCGADQTRFCPYQHTRIVLSVAAIIPLSFGGELIAVNLMTICSICSSGLRSLAEEALFNRIKMRRRSMVRIRSWPHNRNRRFYNRPNRAWHSVPLDVWLKGKMNRSTGRRGGSSSASRCIRRKRQ